MLACVHPLFFWGGLGVRVECNASSVNLYINNYKTRCLLITKNTRRVTTVLPERSDQLKTCCTLSYMSSGRVTQTKDIPSPACTFSPYQRLWLDGGQRSLSSLLKPFFGTLQTSFTLIIIPSTLCEGVVVPDGVRERTQGVSASLGDSTVSSLLISYYWR